MNVMLCIIDKYKYTKRVKRSKGSRGGSLPCKYFAKNIGTLCKYCYPLSWRTLCIWSPSFLVPPSGLAFPTFRFPFLLSVHYCIISGCILYQVETIAWTYHVQVSSMTPSPCPTQTTHIQTLSPVNALVIKNWHELKPPSLPPPLLPLCKYFKLRKS